MKKLLFSFDGRIGRKTWWLTSLALMALAMVVPLVAVGLGFVSETLALVAMVVALPVLIAVIWATLALQAKRWHDHDKSGWWFLINLVPMVGSLYALYMLGFAKGAESHNKYGADPVPGGGMPSGALRTA